MKLLAIVLAVIAVASCEEYYDADLSNVDTAVIIQNKDAVDALHGCFLYEGPCGPIAEKIRTVLEEAIREACSKCNTTHKRNANIYTNHLKTKRPELYEEFTKKYDPELKYMAAFEKAIGISQ